MIDFKQKYSALLDQLIEKAEFLYGPKTNEYYFGGIEYHSKGPCIWFNNEKVFVHLTSSTILNYNQGVFQLSHEVIHLLSPFGQAQTNSLEEGLAVHFSLEMTELITRDLNYVSRAKESLKETVYYEPYLFVSELLLKDHDSIKKLRKNNPVIGKITFDDFKNAELQISDETINKLVKTVEYQTNH